MMLNEKPNQDKPQKAEFSEKRTSFEGQLTKLSLFSALPPYLLLIWVMIYANISIYLVLLVMLIGGLVIVFCHSKIHQKSAYQFRSLSNLLDAMVQGDYSLRARTSEGDKALNELVGAINSLALRLNKQRIESIENQLLLQTVIKHIDVAIIAFNESNELVLCNPAARNLLQITGTDNGKAFSYSGDQLAQVDAISNGQSQVMTLTFSDQQGKYNVHKEVYRRDGKQQELLFITDVSTMLRSEERKAWQALVRVISHEINNSLSPIASISQSLKRLLIKNTDIEAHSDFLLEGLTVIAQRTNNLGEFVNSYKQIASLPEPVKQQVSISSLVNKVTKLYPEHTVEVLTLEDINLSIDVVQLEQVLINLVKNAVEAINNAGVEGRVSISWQQQGKNVKLSITDDGTGVSNPDNLFVPFYTTKAKGSGIGLVLCRQIIEAHGGKIHLTNRGAVRGCIATIELPL
ncbi:MAG TPA: PAS domain-containing sensor histidine kinase [Colwellia sp.]|nr:PAS domain-containing sensor histidine kinase [Colwellia sp.]|tara:strand:+ start:104 stop:1486 length:1383 start_codon:yes stop_codon:yes gene_type:complete